MAYLVLRERAAFKRVVKQGQNRSSKHLRLFWLDNSIEANRYGVAATTKVGGAVERNRVRRWSRELFRRWDSDLVQGQDIVVMANRPGADEAFAQHAAELADLLVRAQLGQRTHLLAANSEARNVQ